MDPTDNNESEPSKKRVRKSRFDDALPIVDSTIQTTDAAILAATELSKKIMNDKIMQENAIKATAMQSHLASQIASIGTILKTVQNNAQQAKEKRPQYHALRLDSLGREIDEHGNLIKQDVGQIKTLALNNSVVAAKRKKENPYLAHRTPSIPLSVPGLQSIPPSLVAASTFAASASATSAASATASASTSMATMGQLPMQIANSEAIASASETLGQPSKPDEEVIDDRITTTNRDRRKKKALRFVEPGKYVQIADDIQRKEERKIIAGYSSGRKSFQTITSTDQSTDADTIKEEGDDGVDSDNSDDDSDDADADVPPPVDEGVVPSMEWWDEAFLPKTVRDNRKISRAAADVDDSSQLMLQYGKSYKYVQHPVAIKALGGERVEAPLPMYLTKKERKRIRKQARAERENEKRDKIMMGLIPAPEPKFKLSNFMKLIGDQAVADPSKVEQRVMQQMRQRIMSHEMRNLAGKLTPAERKQKTIRKLQEDTSRQVHIAVFRVNNFSNPKHRFKVDVNAQQHFLSGLVVLNQEEKEKCNVIIIEGGPKGIRKMINLMTKRIKWEEMVAVSSVTGGTDGEGGDASIPQGYELDQLDSGTWEQGNQQSSSSGNDYNDKDDDDDDDDDDDEEEGNNNTNANGNTHANGHKDNHSTSDGEPLRLVGNKCVLIWQGVVPKRTFTGFKFQEAGNAVASKKLFVAKNVAHYFDMAANKTNM